MAAAKHEVVLIRHGETAWSLSGQHTGRSDIPLTDHGREMAAVVGRALSGRSFTLVLTSPMQRARETCRIAGFSDRAQVRDDLMEWDYGEYEGLTTPQIRETRPDWLLWRDGVLEGETAAQIGRRVDRIIQEARAADGDVALFAHGHVLRVLAARWLDLPPEDGRLLLLGTATLNILGYERDQPVLCRWNAPATG